MTQVVTASTEGSSCGGCGAEGSQASSLQPHDLPVHPLSADEEIEAQKGAVSYADASAPVALGSGDPSSRLDSAIPGPPCELRKVLPPEPVSLSVR